MNCQRAWIEGTGLNCQPRIWAEATEHDSAVSALIEWVGYKQKRDQRSLLRRVIFLNHEPSPEDLLMIKIGAKRYSRVPSAENLPTQIDQKARAIERPQIRLQATPVHALASEVTLWRQELRSLFAQPQCAQSALELLDRIAASLERRKSSRRVGAALLCPKGRVLRVAFNMPWLCHIWHAEWLLLKEHLAENPLADLKDHRVVSTLKPCRMCAALIQRSFSLREGTPPRVIYQHFDPGPQAARTLLNAGSPDRLRFIPQLREEEWEELASPTCGEPLAQ